jgi:tellurite resistance protein TehA-like permease
MGTGIASILLHNFPYPARWLRYLGTIVFVLNVAVFVLLLGATVARYALWPVWRTVAHHKVAGMFWGCFPMGFATIVVSFLLVMRSPEHDLLRLRARLGRKVGVHRLRAVVG